jgi:hypothetical protein
LLNHTNPAKYGALEKNAVSEPKTPQLDNLRYREHSRKAPLYWEIFGLFIGREMGARGSLAEGEELGSNLLQERKDGIAGSGPQRNWGRSEAD